MAENAASDDEFVIIGAAQPIDVVVAGAASTVGKLSRQQKRGRSKRLLAAVEQPGPLALVAILGCSQQPCYTSRAKIVLSDALGSFLQGNRRALGLADASVSADAALSHTLLGFVLMQTWQFVQGVPHACVDDSIEHQLMKTIISQRHTSGRLGFIRLPIVASAALEHPVQVTAELAGMALWKPTVGQQLETLLRLSPEFMVRCHSDVPVGDADTIRLKYDSVLQTWHDEFGVSLSSSVPYGWRVWDQLGEVMVRAAWPGDLVSVSRCDKSRLRISPFHLPRLAELLYLEHCVNPANPDVNNAQAAHAVTGAEIFNTKSK